MARNPEIKGKVQGKVQPNVLGMAESERAVTRLSEELRRVRTVAIFLAKGVMKMQQARREAIALPPEACKHYMHWDFPVLQGPKAESTIENFAQLDDMAAERAENKYLGKAGIRDNEGWIPVTCRYPGAQPYTWSRSVLVMLDTGGIAISSYLDRQNLDGQWLNLEEGFGTVTHWHELPPTPSDEQQQAVMAVIEKTRKPKHQGTVQNRRAGHRPARPAMREIYSGGMLRDGLRTTPKNGPATHGTPSPNPSQIPRIPFPGNEKISAEPKEDIRWI